MTTPRNFSALLLLVLVPGLALARYDVNRPAPGTGKRKTPRTAAACLPSTSSAELNINNVRCLLHNGGDMWWDLVSNPRYEVPKVSNPADAKHSMFAGSLWIGGFDGSGQLRIAAQTYRQSGNDFFPGPLRIDGTASTDDVICNRWDKHFTITKAEIDAFRAEYAKVGSSVNMASYPNVRDWPGNNPDFPEFERNLAPYRDENQNGIYDPTGGDYPVTIPVTNVVADQFIWWVINDKGDIHTETNGEQIGVEIHMTAFAFATSNDINNMTFYREVVYNRSTNVLSDCYIGQWADADLGFFADDYVGCDTIRGLGIVYNGDNDDNLPNGYGANPPAVGIDFFQGPFADPADGVDNDKDGIQDEVGERIGMAKFIYYNKDFSIRGNPSTAQHFYGYLAGFWRNGASIVDDRTGNGNGYPDPGETYTPSNYMFPDYPGSSCGGISCPNVSYLPSGQGWDETCVGLDPFDRRFVQSAGPFTLQPGATNDIVVGVVWARDLNSGNQLGSVCRLLQADDVAQALFDNNFDLVDGPAAPDLQIEEFDQELVLSWTYTNPNQNNFYENYQERDPTITVGDPFYRFEGYIIYQLLDGTVSPTELEDPARAIPIVQCDVKNGISTVVNRVETNIPGVSTPIINDQVMVEGDNNGLFHSFRVTEDAFATSSERRLVNYRDYYFMIVAYAVVNNDSINIKFIRGRENVRSSMAVPHKTEFENMGMNLFAAYGDGPVVTQTRGQGNGGRFVRYSEETENQILSAGVAPRQFLPGSSPVNIKVVNAKEVKDLKYRVVVTRDLFRNSELITDGTGLPTDSLYYYIDWRLLSIDRSTGAPINTLYEHVWVVRKNLITNTTDSLPRPLDGTEQVIAGHGISVAIADVSDPGSLRSRTSENNGLIGAEVVYADPSKPWLDALPDVDQAETFNWIRSGPACAGSCPGGTPCVNGVCTSEDGDFRIFSDSLYYQALGNYDPEQVYQTVLSGNWAPYILSAHFHTGKDIVGPRLRIRSDDLGPLNTDASMLEFKRLSGLNNVDIVITRDPSKWSRCLVIESSPAKNLSTGAHPMAPRWAKNRQLNGCDLQTVGGPALDPAGDRLAQEYGFSYFPGYAIDLDRGQRVNIFFAESSWHRELNGDDMLWNPKESFGSDGKGAGGRHYVYVTDQPYDGCAQLGNFRVKNQNVIAGSASTGYIYDVDGANVRLDSLYKHVTWVTIPLVSDPIYEFNSYCNIPSDARIALRVNKQFRRDALTNEDPTFEFDMGVQAAAFNVRETAKKSVTDLIRVVPNPYYGRSGFGNGSYEVNQIDNRVKFTNLPQKCTIRIFTLNGQLVRVFRKESDAPDQEWDLKNDNGVPIASGLYVIHVDAGDLGEKILKFFCIVSELDLNAY